MNADRRKKNILELTLMTPGEYRRASKLPLIVVADSVRSLHNVGALFRTADVFRYRGIILGGISGTPPHPELHKTALGAEDTVEWRHEPDTLAAVEELKRQGWLICVLEQTLGSVSLHRYTMPPKGNPMALVVGNEVSGVDQRIADIADVVLEIPQQGTKHSLNVSVSAGMAMWELAKPYLP